MRLGALGLAMVAFVAAGPWIVGTHGYAVFIPCIVASGGDHDRRHGARPVRAGACWTDRRFGTGARHAAPRSSARSRFSPPTSIATSGTGGCRLPASIPTAYVPADDALEALRDSAIYPNINRADYARHRLSAGRADVLPGRHAHCRDVDGDAAGHGGMRGRHRRCHHRPASAIAAAGDCRGRMGVASAGDLGDRQQRSCRRADGRADDARRLAAGAQPSAGRSDCGGAGGAGQALCRSWSCRPSGGAGTGGCRWRSWRPSRSAICPISAPAAGVLGFVTTGYLVGGRVLAAAMASGSSRSCAACIGQVPGLTAAYVLVALGVLAWLALRARGAHGDARRRRRSPTSPCC